MANLFPMDKLRLDDIPTLIVSNREAPARASGPPHDVSQIKLQASESVARVECVSRITSTNLKSHNKAEIWERFLDDAGERNRSDLKSSDLVSKGGVRDEQDAEFVFLDDMGDEVVKSEIEKLDDYMDANTCKAMLSALKKDERW